MNENFKIEPDFYKEEVRCGYTVTEKQKKIWAVELDLLHKLLTVCEKYNIKVFAHAGTALGAVRHQGFIPWDDDVDVVLLHDDYLKLLKVAKKEFKEPYFFQTALTDRKFFFRYARLRNSNTTGYITEYPSRDYNQGIFVDVFVFNGYQQNKWLRQIQGLEMKLAWKACRAYIADLKTKKWYKRPVIGLAQIIERAFIPYEKLVKWSWHAQSKYDRTAKRVSNIGNGIDVKYNCSIEDFKKAVYLKFENLMIPVPVNYHRFLTNIYGDYMKLPPVEQRGKWHENVIEFDPDTPYKEYVRRNYPKI